MKVFGNHFSGEGNGTSNIAKSEQLHDSLHYKNESFMVFELFLNKFQKMYNIFEEEGEPM